MWLNVISGYFNVLKENRPILDSSFSLTQPTCGQANGAINFTGHDSTNAYNEWLDSAGHTISSYQQEISNLYPSKYYYRLLLNDDSTCYSTVGPLILQNQAGATLQTTKIQITDASCGKANGSITGINYQNTSGAVYLAWADSVGNIVSNTINLLEVPSGKYQLKFKDGGGCDTITTAFYTVGEDGIINFDTSKISISIPACNGTDGSIQGITSTNATIFKWVNLTLHDTIGNSEDISNIASGSYQLFFSNTYGCKNNTDTIVVGEKTLAFDTSQMKIVPASCNGADGSITGITSTNAAIFKWINLVTHDTVGNTQNITNIPSGNYQLICKNAFGCEIKTDTIYVGEQKLTLDTTHLQTSPSTCKGTNGSITGITSTNATIYTWVNTTTGNTVGNNENLTGAAAGEYQLTCSNSYGCKINTDTITVNQAGFLADTVVNVIIWDANCNLDNGYITINQFTKDSSSYSFQWIDSATNSVISTHTNINNLTPGFYRLYATDTGGCKQQIFAARITQQGKPQFDYSQLKIISDTCNQGVGAVLFQSNNPNNYTWAGYNIAGQPQSTSPLGIINLTAGQYYATITDQYNCTAGSDTFTVNNIDVIPPSPQAADQLIPRGTQATIVVTNVQPGTYICLCASRY